MSGGDPWFLRPTDSAAIDKYASVMLSMNPARAGAADWRLAVRHARLVRGCIEHADADGAAWAAFRAMQHVVRAEIAEGPEPLFREMEPQAEKGRKFTGRGRGAGPVRKAIRAALKRRPSLKNDDLWEHIKANPPRGWRAFESKRLGKYLEGPTVADVTRFDRFRNIAAEVRRDLKSA